MSSEALLIMDLVSIKFCLSKNCDVYFVGLGFFF